MFLPWATYEEEGVGMRIVWKIIITVLSLSVFLIVLFSAFHYQQQKKWILSYHKDSTTREVQQIQNLIHLFFEDIEQNLDLLSGVIPVAEIDASFFSLLQPENPEMTIQPEYSSDAEKRILSLFREYLSSHPQTTMLYLGTVDGGYLEFPVIPLGNGYDPRLRPWFQTAIQSPGKVVLTSPYMTQFSQTPQIGAVKTVGPAGEAPVGVLGINLSLALFSNLLEQLQVRNQGVLVLVDGAGRVLSHPRESSLLFSSVEKLSPSFQDLSAFKGEYGEVILDGEVNLGLVVPDPRFGWSFISLVPKKEVFRDLNQQTLLILLVSLSMLFLAFMYAFVVGRNISRPLETFARDVARFDPSRENDPVPEEGSYETRLAAKSFNRLASQLENAFEQNREANSRLREMNATLEKNNRILHRSFEEAEEYARAIEEITTITSRMTTSALHKDESFLRDLLEMLMALIPKADCGSISLFEGDRWRFVHAVGHDIEILRDLDLKRSYFAPGDRLILIQNIIQKNQAIMPEELNRKFGKATKPIQSSIISRLVFGALELGSIALDIEQGKKKEFSEEEVKMVRAFSNVASAFITMQNYIIQQDKFQKDLLRAMIRFLEIHDPYTRGHSESVAVLASRLAREMGMETEQVDRVFWAGMVHDLGKILIPGNILTKVEPLTEEEFQLIKEHPSWGGKVLHSFDDLQDVARFVEYHHERWDGKGYPEGLMGTQIPLVSRILTIADSFDAMTSDRPYRRAISLEKAYEEMETNSGSQFDPELVPIFVEVVRKMEREGSWKSAAGFLQTGGDF